MATTWLVQDCKDRQTKKIVDALELTSEPYQLVSLDRETGQLTSQVEGVDYIPYGSTALSKLAYTAGWRGCFHNKHMFNMACYNANHPRMLNKNGFVVDLRMARRLACARKDWFIRPCDDTKSFAGMLVTSKELNDWVKVLEDDWEVNGDTIVYMSEPKQIDMEWRYFIVDEKIVSGSIYRYKGASRLERELDEDVLCEAQALADMWLPHPCCVMDVAFSETLPYVVEFNGINSSGFYDHDVPAIVAAMSEYVKEKTYGT